MRFPITGDCKGDNEVSLLLNKVVDKHVEFLPWWIYIPNSGVVYQ